MLFILGEITPTGWKPIAPPLTFPSAKFLSTLQQSTAASMQGNDGSSGKDQNIGLTDKQPLYADPNRQTFDQMSKTRDAPTAGDRPQHDQALPLHNHQEL